MHWLLTTLHHPYVQLPMVLSKAAFGQRQRIFHRGAHAGKVPKISSKLLFIDVHIKENKRKLGVWIWQGNIHSKAQCMKFTPKTLIFKLKAPFTIGNETFLIDFPTLCPNPFLSLFDLTSKRIFSQPPIQRKSKFFLYMCFQIAEVSVHKRWK